MLAITREQVLHCASMEREQSRYNRVRAAGWSRSCSASTMAKALLTRTISCNVHSVSAGEMFARQAAENRM